MKVVPEHYGQAGHELDRVCEGVRADVAIHLRARLAELHPAYFALAMATGIVAISCHLFGLPHLATTLSWINLAAYPTLWILYIARAALFGDRVVADWWDHGRAPGYFTVVAATGVLGTQVILLHDGLFAAKILWWVCVALWAAFTYTVFTLLTVVEKKPALEEGINGGWLVAVVATQSVCVLGCTLNGAVLPTMNSPITHSPPVLEKIGGTIP